MKRKLYVFLVLGMMIAIIGMVACKYDANVNTDSFVVDASIYETLESLSKANYAGIMLSTSMVEGTKELSGEYDVKIDGEETSIEYSYQKFALFEFDDNDDLIVPEKEIETLTGSLTLKNGEVVSSNGDEINVSVENVTAGISFKKKNFKNATVGDNRFTADVVNAEQYIGITGASNMTVKVDYSENALTNLVIEFEVDSASFTFSYEFKK